MRFDPNRKPTGKCRFCGKPTKLLIHQNCHSPDKPPKKLRPLVGAVATHIIGDKYNADEKR